jgi:FkbM family methyltransferase
MKIFFKIPRICWEIGTTKKFLVSNILKIYRIYLFNRLYSNQKSEGIKISSGKKSIIFTISNMDDLIALHEIFVLNTYKAFDTPRTIVDLGANIGIASLYFAVKYPNAQIFAFEPNPDVFSILSKNMIAFDNVKTYPFLISGETSENKSFFVSKKRTHSSSVLDRGEDFAEYGIRSFKLCDLMNFLELEKVDLLKFDIEGAEFDLFKDLNEVNIKEFVGEVHMDLAPEGIVLESFNLKEKYSIQSIGAGRRFNLIGSRKQS